jgi:hypothetical protein
MLLHWHKETPVNSVKKFESRRLCIVSAGTGQFVSIYGDAVTAVVEHKPLPTQPRMWIEFRGTAPPKDYDASTLSSSQRDEILALVTLHLEKEVADMERYIQETLDMQDWLKMAISRIDAGFSPLNDDFSQWHYRAWLDNRSDPNCPWHDLQTWAPIVLESPSSDLQNTERKWRAERLREFFSGRLPPVEHRLRDYKKTLRMWKTRVQDRYFWAEVHTETVKTVTITPV